MKTNPTNPFELIEKGKHHNEVVRAASTCAETDLIEFGSKVSDEAFPHVAVEMTQTYEKIDVQAMLMIGCYFLLWDAVTSPEHRREMREAFFEDLGTNRSQAYRARDAWRCFGALILAEPDLSKMFVVEAMKRLAAASVPEAARQEAIARGRAGEKINGKVVDELLRKHGVAESTATASKTAPKKTKGWSFSGDAVQIRVTSNNRKPCDRLQIIGALRAFIAQLQQENYNQPETATIVA